MEKETNPIKSKNLILFTPEQWGVIVRFEKFHNLTYKFNPTAKSAISGAYRHFHKYEILKNLALKLVPEFKKENEELMKKGYSKAIVSQELTAIIETLFCELYSSVDCTRTVIAAVYHKHNGVPSGSTSKMFRYASENKMDEKILIEIIKALADGYNDWFPRLKDIRDTVNHSNTGSCYAFEEKIYYINSSLEKQGNNTLLNDDIFKELLEYETKVHAFLYNVYHTLNQTLKDEEIIKTCGIFNSNGYHRFVSPYKAINFDSGRCKSREWFEKDDNLTCPYVDTCGAYKNSKIVNESDSP